MPGPCSAPTGARTDRGKVPHEKCPDRERCTGAGCRVRTGKTDVTSGRRERQAHLDHMARVAAALKRVALTAG
jgi:hypothetical protein